MAHEHLIPDHQYRTTSLCEAVDVDKQDHKKKSDGEKEDTVSLPMLHRGYLRLISEILAD